MKKVLKEVISGYDIVSKSKKMNAQELQEHMKNVRQGVGVHKNKKAYSRKEKHKGGAY